MYRIFAGNKGKETRYFISGDSPMMRSDSLLTTKESLELVSQTSQFASKGRAFVNSVPTQDFSKQRGMEGYALRRLTDKELEYLSSGRYEIKSHSSDGHRK